MFQIIGIVGSWCATGGNTQALTLGFGCATYLDYHYALISSPHSAATEEFLGADRTTPLSAYNFLSSLYSRGLVKRRGWSCSLREEQEFIKEYLQRGKKTHTTEHRWLADG